MRRRTIFVLPLAAALPSWASARAWRENVSELRVGVSGGEARTLAHAVQVHLGMRVLPARHQGVALVEALDAGHIEAALLDKDDLVRACAAMGERLVVLSRSSDDRTGVVRRILPAEMRTALAQAIQA